MSTLAAIQEAIAKLSADDRNVLIKWLTSRYEPQINPEDEQAAESSDEAIKSVKDLDAGI